MKIVSYASAFIIAMMAWVSIAASAADAENTQSTTVDHSKNPITGTKKTVKKTTKTTKDGAGHEAESTVKETTKVKTDGTTEKKTETEGESSSKGH